MDYIRTYNNNDIKPKNPDIKQIKSSVISFLLSRAFSTKTYIVASNSADSNVAIKPSKKFILNFLISPPIAKKLIPIVTNITPNHF